MTQVKKDAVRQALLQAGRQLFLQQGYAETQMAAIAKQAGTSKSNIYKYFGSKFELLMALYEPWLRHRVQLLATDVLAQPQPKRLRVFVRIFLEDIPQEDEGFANLLMQALATAPTDYRPDLLHWFEGQLVNILRTSLGDTISEIELPRDQRQFSRI